uniref:Uncharacterized protein n=1 Tax=Corethron hystrix TaxID=216773 RepID=A0A7S1C0R3_9STRA|mmetsp:Transcript_7001/g.15155  ORF Transcript_7001/g.15155 Transcript_7001/m.15155 type:complete len:140 (+) Transcript_7001:307-726(+)
MSERKLFCSSMTLSTEIQVSTSPPQSIINEETSLRPLSPNKNLVQSSSSTTNSISSFDQSTAAAISPANNMISSHAPQESALETGHSSHIDDTDDVVEQNSDYGSGIDQGDGTGETEEETDDDEPVKLFVGQVSCTSIL